MSSRIASAVEDGLEYEADQRRAEVIVKALVLPKESKSGATPEVSEREEQSNRRRVWERR